MATIDMNKLRSRVKAFRDHYEEFVEPQHIKLSDKIMPERGRFRSRDTNKNENKNRFTTLLDHTPAVAAKRLAASLHAGLNPPERDWLKLESKDKSLMEIGSVKVYLDRINREIKQLLHETHAYNSLADSYKEDVVFGISAIFVERDTQDLVLFHTFTAGTYCVGVDKKGRVNRFYRFYCDTADNLADKFGADKISPKVRDLIETNKGHTLIDVVHATEPNLNRDITKEDNLNMPWSSVYYEEKVTGQPPLRESGFQEFPYIVSRYETVETSDAYGQSPCNNILGLTQSLQDMTNDLLVASKKMIAPMLNVPSSFKRIKRGPNAVNKYNAQEGAPVITAAYQVQYDFSGNLQASAEFREAINKILNADLFSAISSIDKSNMTATEVNERVAEAIQNLVAVVTRMNTEKLKPLIELIYKILLEADRFGEPPPELEGQDLEIVFISSLAQAQQAVGISTIEQLTDYVTRVAQIDPSVLKKFNSQQAVDEMMRMSGAPPSVVRTDDEVKELEAEEAIIAEQNRTAELLSMTADGAQKLGNTPMNTGSALDTVVEGIQNAG